MDEDRDVNGVIQTVDAALNYRMELSQLLAMIQEAKDQVTKSSNQSQTKLKSHFDNLKVCIIKALDDRFTTLMTQIEDIETSSLDPLRQCEDLLQMKVDVATHVLKTGKDLLGAANENKSSPDVLREFAKKSKEFDLNSLPEVPALWETPCLHIDLPRDEETIQKQLVDAIKDYGRVLSRPPVLITDLIERPAAVLVKWDISQMEDHCGLDLDTFKLQYCDGSICDFNSDGANFKDVYQGPASSYVVRNLDINKIYSFRICGRAEGAFSWSPWSVPRSSSTTLPNHEWRAETKGYILSNNNMTAATEVGSDVVQTTDVKVAPNSTHILYSQIDSYICGHSIMIRVDAIGDGCKLNDGFGLSFFDNHSDGVFERGVFFLSAQGIIFVDGQEKTTRLPPATKGSVITFETESLHSNKVRVTVEVSEKIVTFDWTKSCQNPKSGGPVALSSGSESTKDMRLFFLAKLSSPGWIVTVE